MMVFHEEWITTIGTIKLNWFILDSKDWADVAYLDA